MSLHKLSAGSGYDYLTRQVAVQDSTEKGHQSLTTYYSEHGEGSSRFVVNDPAVAGIHATVLAALANRIRVR